MEQQAARKLDPDQRALAALLLWGVLPLRGACGFSATEAGGPTRDGNPSRPGGNSGPLRAP